MADMSVTGDGRNDRLDQRNHSRPAPRRWDVTGDGATGFGATFAEAWHGRQMEFDE